MNKNIAVLLVALAAGCASAPADRVGGTAANPSVGEAVVPPLDPKRKISEQDCSNPVDTGGGNLRCREVTEAERRAKREEEERQARARKEAQERAERERLERERAAQLAREEAARKAREAEEARLAAERRRLEEEAARKAREEREAREKAEAELRARQLAEQQAREAVERAAREAREAAERECRRLEQERLDGRAVLEGFVANYGTVDEYTGIAGQISTFLARPRKPKPCP